MQRKIRRVGETAQLCHFLWQWGSHPTWGQRESNPGLRGCCVTLPGHPSSLSLGCWSVKWEEGKPTSEGTLGLLG